MYYGPLSPFEISEEIIAILKTEESFSYKEYRNYLLDKGSDYRAVELSDSSTWILRLGNNRDTYVHIHPGKYSHHSIRIRALTLKAAIIYIIYTNREKDYMTEIDRLNYVRKEYLKLSPQKNYSWEHGVGKLVKLLRHTL